MIACREQPSAPLGSFLWSESVGFRFCGSKGNISGAQRTKVLDTISAHADELATILLFRLQLLTDAPHFDERQRCSYRNQTAEDNEHNEVHLRRPLFLKNMTQAGALRRDPRWRVPRRHDSAEPEPARHA